MMVTKILHCQYSVGVSAECGTVKTIVQTVQEVNSSNSGYLEHGETSSTQTAESTPAMNDSNTVVVNTEPEVSQPVDNLTDKDPKTHQLPKPKMYIQFLPKYPEEDADSDSWIRAYVHSRAGKASGKYANCFNIQLEGDDDVKCVDWTELALDWKKDNNTSEREEEVLLSSVTMYDQSVVDAQQAELTKFKQNNVYEEVDDIGQSTVGVRWVITQKPEGPVKARLVALGFQESSNEIRKDSPICNKDSIRLLLMTAASSEWTIQHIDVQAAFLQGRRITRDVFIIPPFEAETNTIWKLNKCIYGLVDGPRMWYIELRDTLIQLEMVVSSYDESFLFWYQNKKLMGVIAVHVDDMIFCGHKLFKQKVIAALKKKFRLSTEVELEFSYTGLDIKQTQSSILVSQLGYCDHISEIEINGTRINQNNLPINDNERKQLRTVCGQLLWISTQSRPDVAYFTCFASNSVTTGKISDLKMVNKTVRFVKGLLRRIL